MQFKFTTMVAAILSVGLANAAEMTAVVAAPTVPLGLVDVPVAIACKPDDTAVPAIILNGSVDVKRVGAAVKAEEVLSAHLVANRTTGRNRTIE